MSASGPPLCRLCNQSHWMRDPHILPANAPAEKRSNRAATTNGADTNCRTLRTDPRMPEGVPGTGRRGMNGQREVSRQGIVRPTQKPKRRTPETPGAAAPKPVPNTRREGRRVLKAEAARPDATRTAATAKPNPPTPPARSMAEEQTKADKVTPGKRKTEPKKKAQKGKK